MQIHLNFRLSSYTHGLTSSRSPVSLLRQIQQIPLLLSTASAFLCTLLHKYNCYRMDKILLGCLLLGLWACTPTSTESTSAVEEVETPITDSAAWVVEQAIIKHGGDVVDSSRVLFTFREREYIAERQGGQFIYQRRYTDKEGQAVADRMTNNSFVREIDGEEVTLTDKQLSSYSNSLNSVMYFAFLPYFLEDQAVQLNYQGVGVVRGEPHYKVKVTFAEEGGGKDFEDEYIYWFAQDDFQLNYLAYNFLVNEGGARFREAYNARQVGGILFQDYINYKPTEDRRDVLAFDALLDAGALDTLSKIELVDITVE